MKIESNLPITLQLSLADTNNIISALNSKIGEIAGVINSLQQQAATQVAAAQALNSSPVPPGEPSE